MNPPNQKVNDGYLKALGSLVVAYSKMENTMKIFANVMTNAQDNTGEIFTCDLPAQPLREKLISLYRFKEQNIMRIHRLETLVEKTSGLTTRRNTMVHGVWWFAPLIKQKNALRTKASTRGRKYELEQQKVPISDIEILIKEIDEITKELDSILLTWMAENNILYDFST